MFMFSDKLHGKHICEHKSSYLMRQLEDPRFPEGRLRTSIIEELRRRLRVDPKDMARPTPGTVLQARVLIAYEGLWREYDPEDGAPPEIRRALARMRDAILEPSRN
jgi:hypothetical protein